MSFLRFRQPMLERLNMKSAVNINWGRVTPDEDVAEFVEEHVGRLESLFDRVHSCRITMDAVRPIRSRVGEFQVVIRVSVPRRELVVKHAGRSDLKSGVFPVLAASFNAMTRKLREYKQSLRHTGGDRQSIRHLEAELMEVA